jgi:hypothetical protein
VSVTGRRRILTGRMCFVLRWVMVLPYIHLDDLGLYVCWIFDTLSESVGLNLKIATEHVGYAYLAETFTAEIGKPAPYENITMGEAFANPSFLPGDYKLGAEDEGENDNTLMTVWENFSAWWRIYQRFCGNKGIIQGHYEFLDRILPGRVKSIREWMEKTGYTADHKPLLHNGGKSSRHISQIALQAVPIA